MLNSKPYLLVVRDFAEAQHWTALAYAKPGKAVEQIARAFSQLQATASEFNSTDKTEILRLASLVETFAEPLAEAQLEPLLVYTPCNGKLFSWRSQHKLETLQAEWDLYHQKLSKLRHALVAETDAAKKFQLEQQIFDEKAKLAYLDNEMKKIESALQP